MAVQEEVCKEQRTSGFNNEHDTVNEAYRRIYGATKAVLLKRFRQEKAYPQLRSISLTELKEFIYWLFKYRLEQCEKPRVACDTKKALEQLQQQLAIKGFSRGLVTDKLAEDIGNFVGKGGLEPPRLAAHDPKSCSSASSDTPPFRFNGGGWLCEKPRKDF